MSQEPCTLSVNTAFVRDSVSFFGASPVTKQVIDGSIESVVSALVNLGLCSTEPPAPACPAPSINPTLCAGPFDASGLGSSEISDVSMSGDTVVVGTKLDASGLGAAHVYFRTSGVWDKQGPGLSGSGAVGAAQQGTSVAIHGNTLVIGGPMDNDSQGAVWVFTRPEYETTWTQQGPKITVPGSSQFGTSVHIRGDTLVVGAPGDNSMQGSFSVFKRFEGLWIPEQTSIVPSDVVGGAHVGAALKINDMENTIVVSGAWDNGSVGAVWVFRLVDDVWVQDGLKITGSGIDNSPPNYLGHEVAVSGDGNYLVFSGPYDAVQDGGVWTFKYVDGVWVQDADKIKWIGAQFGRSLDMSSCGTLMIVGTEVGVYVFKKFDGVWNYMCERMIGDLAYFGSHASLDQTGGDFVVTSLDSTAVHAYMYRM